MHLYDNILALVKKIDSTSRISSVSRRDADDGVLVRLVTSDDSLGVLRALRDALPLASVSLVENLVDGRTEAQLLLPNSSEQRTIATHLAQFSAGQRPLRLLANVLIAVLAISCANHIIYISRQ